MRGIRSGYAIVLAAAALSLWAYPRLPPMMPVHWDAQGHPNGYAPRLVAVTLIPLTMIVLRLLFAWLPVIDPRGANYRKFAKTYWLLVNGLLLFLGLVHGTVLAYGLGYPVRVQRVLPVALGVLFIVFGNYLSHVEPNWFIGIRTPWTLSSDSVWRRTHRVGGRIMVLGGIIAVLTAFLPAGSVGAVLIGTVVTVAAVTVVLSYVLWSRERRAAS